MRLKAVLALIGAACCVAAVSGGASGAVAPSQCSGPAGGDGVAIHVHGSPSVFCSAGVIRANEDVHGSFQYTVCGPLGKGCHPTTVTAAISIKHLLHVAHITGVQLAEVVPSSGSPSILVASALDSPPGNGGIVEFDPHATYLGPAGSGTSIEEIGAPDGGVIDLHAYTGRLLSVSVVVESAGTTVAVGKRVQFSATPYPSGFTYHWSFPDGTETTPGNTVTHSFGSRGTFSVYVTVVGPDGAAGASLTPAQINVQPIPSKRSLNPPGRGGKKNNSSTGGSGGASVNGSTGTTTTPTTTTPTNPITPTYTPPPASSGTGRLGHPGSSRPPTAASPGHGQKVVEGRLISSVTPVSAADLASGNGVAVTTTSQARVRSTSLVTGPLTPVAGLAAAGVIILLLGSGAGRELRSLRRSIASARLA